MEKNKCSARLQPERHLTYQFYEGSKKHERLMASLIVEAAPKGYL